MRNRNAPRRKGLGRFVYFRESRGIPLDAMKHAASTAIVALMVLGLFAPKVHCEEAPSASGAVPGGQAAAGGVSQTAAGLRDEARQRYTTGRTDDPETGKIFQRAADMGDPLAVMWLARLTRSGKAGILKNPARAVTLAESSLPDVRRLAEAGDAAAQYLLGMAFYEALGEVKDNEKAFAWLLAAAKQGDVLAMGNVSSLLFEGIGTPKDEAAAVTWCSKAAEQGDAAAFAKLGYFYHWGLGVDADIEKALEYYLKAERAGIDTSSARAALTGSRSRHPFKADDIRGLPYVKLFGLRQEEFRKAVTDSGLLPAATTIKETKADRDRPAALECADEGVRFGLRSGRLKDVELYSVGVTGYSQFKGLLPLGLAWEDTVESVRQKLGPPDSEGGVERDGAYGMAYFVDSITLSVMFFRTERRQVKLIRIYERWPAKARGVAVADAP